MVKIFRKHLFWGGWVVLLGGLLLLGVNAGCGRGPTIDRLGPAAVVLAFGDSLTAGTGASTTTSYPAVLESLLQRQVVNAGVPGEVAARGLERLPGVVAAYQPDLVILCHGGNDLLLQEDPAELQATLARMIEFLQKQGIDVVIVGVPQPSLILRTAPFYRELAREYRLPYEGKVLQDILMKASLMSDEVHPNAEGYRKMAEALAALIERSQR